MTNDFTEPLADPGWVKEEIPDPRNLPMRPLLFRAASPDPFGYRVHPFTMAKLNQGATGTCTQHSVLHHGMCDPMPTPRVLLPAGFALYDWAVAQDAYAQNNLDLDPGRTFGTTANDIMRAGRAYSMWDGWVRARNMDELQQWLDNEGPILLGIDWSSKFNRVDDEGFIPVATDFTGGHMFLLNGYDRRRTAHSRAYGNCIQSYGPTAGDGTGEFKIEWDYLEHLTFGRGGDVIAAVQTGPMPQPPPPAPPPPPPPVVPQAPYVGFTHLGWDQSNDMWLWEIAMQPKPGWAPGIGPYADAPHMGWDAQRGVYVWRWRLQPRGDWTP